MYQMETEIPFVSAGKDGKLKLPEAVAMMTNCCQFQEYREVEFCRFLRENDLAVFLFSLQVDILRMPEFREKVTTAVKVYGCKSIYGLRRLTIRDEKGDLCLIANATGAFFDLKAGKAVKLTPETLPIKFDEAEAMECLPRKIPVPVSGGAEQEVFTVKNSHLDYNGHLTSPVYLAVATDILPEKFTFDRVRVEYKKQASCGESIHPVLFLTGSTAVVDLRDKDGGSFAAVEFSTIAETL